MTRDEKFTQGTRIELRKGNFEAGVRAAVDYRGDVTVELKDGSRLDGYLFNANDSKVELFPRQSPRKASIPLTDIDAIILSGKDESKGKSWEDWLRKKELLKKESQAELPAV